MGKIVLWFDYFIKHAFIAVAARCHVLSISNAVSFFHMHRTRKNWLNNNSKRAPLKIWGLDSREGHEQQFLTNTFSSIGDEINMGDFGAHNDKSGVKDFQDVAQSPYRRSWTHTLVFKWPSNTCTPFMHNFDYINLLSPITIIEKHPHYYNFSKQCVSVELLLKIIDETDLFYQ